LLSSYDLDGAAKRCVLAEYFHLTHFKEFQCHVIDAVLEKRDSLVIQPTGSGKSLCYQFPAVYRKQMTLVITPTISLMQDQTHELESLGISAIYLGSAQTDPNAEKKVFDTDSTVAVVFVSPEWLFGDKNNHVKVQALNEINRLGLVAIDEAHLIYDWQDFRQTYRKCEELHSLFPNVPLMALSATVVPQVEAKLKCLMQDPIVEKSSVNRSNIYLAARMCNFKRSDGSKQSVSLDSRDFNNFADLVTDLIKGECSIIYTDFACHVAPIVLALRDRDVLAIGYYGKMKESEKREAYVKWKSGEIPVIVATRAFGLGINKSNVRYVIRNGLPPSISAWAQEFGRAGRDGQQSYAHIFYSDNDIQHVGYWARDMARQHRPSDIDDAAQQFSVALSFSYAHLAGICRRKLFLQLFGEEEYDMTHPELCCDVCDQTIGVLTDRRPELGLLIQAIDELKSLGEVKITEWLRGGNVAWMQNIVKANPTAYGKSPHGLSKEWWRCFIHQCAAAGYILRAIKPATFGIGTTIQGAYAKLEPTSKGRDVVSNQQTVLLPQLNVSNDKLQTPVCKTSATKSGRVGKGKHMLPILKSLLYSNENWIPLQAKEKYQYPGWHNETTAGNVLYFAEDIKSLPHYSGPHFLWSDVQLSKSTTTKNTFIMQIGSKSEHLHYWLSRCNGVKQCSQCDHVLPRSFVKNNCKQHPTAELISTEGCEVEFVYIFPHNIEDHRRWIGGLIRSTEVVPKPSLHNHPVRQSLSHKIPAKVISDFTKTLDDNPYLTTRQLQCGQGLGYRPGSADLSCSSYDRVDYHRKKIVRDTCVVSTVLGDMERIADKIDEKDAINEGSQEISAIYKKVGRPYMRDFAISATMTYQFIMSPLMSQLLAGADFVETDTTYNENAELTFLFNATVFDYKTMKWAIVARMRGNKESSEFYRLAFKLMFDTCKRDHPNFKVGDSLKGIIVDWSDTEAKGLREVVGEDVAELVLRGCNVHWVRSYQRVAERVNAGEKKENKRAAVDAFCLISKHIMIVNERQHVLQLFNLLRDSSKLPSIQHLNIPLTEEQIAIISKCNWSGANNWVEWWTRPNHLRMLCKPFSKMTSSTWNTAPRNTNGVERANSLAKDGDGKKKSLQCAMQSLYEKDKVFALQYIAADGGFKTTYRSDVSEEQRMKAACKRRARQYASNDSTASLGPPDKKQHFETTKSQPAKKAQRKQDSKTGKGVELDLDNGRKHDVEVRYNDGVWYRGWLSTFNTVSGKWIVKFYDDDETTEVNFPDKDVRLVKM